MLPQAARALSQTPRTGRRAAAGLGPELLQAALDWLFVWDGSEQAAALAAEAAGYSSGGSGESIDAEEGSSRSSSTSGAPAAGGEGQPAAPPPQPPLPGLAGLSLRRLSMLYNAVEQLRLRLAPQQARRLARAVAARVELEPFGRAAQGRLLQIMAAWGAMEKRARGIYGGGTGAEYTPGRASAGAGAWAAAARALAWLLAAHAASPRPQPASGPAALP